LHADAGLAAHPELARQAAIADRLIVTKTDMADPAQVARLHARLKQLNPSAAIATATHGAVDPDWFVGQDAGRWIAEAMPADPAPARRHEAIHSFCVTRDTPLPWSAFGLWLSLLVHRHGAKLLRIKGLLNVTGSDTPVAVHAVQHVIHEPEHLPSWPAEDRRSRLVFIVSGLEGWQVERSFNSFIALAERMGGAPPRSLGNAVHEREQQA
jgi:G3E family GTPase